MANSNPMSRDDNEDRRREREAQAIQEALRGLRFGSINVIVQDGVIVQIDRTEKRRLVKSRSPKNSD